jgi:hypothetical protein
MLITKLGIPFHLEVATIDGAEAATISLSALAGMLGYQDKSKLKQLADRHANELRQFGMTATVAVMLSRGGGAQVVGRELAFNHHQAYYLIMRSETAKARSLAVRFTRAFFELLRMYYAPAQPKQLPPTKSPLEVIAATAKSAYTSALVLLKLEKKLDDLSDKVGVTAQRGSTTPTHARKEPPTPETLVHWTVGEYMRTNKLSVEKYWPSSMGRRASTLYRKKYGAEPPKSRKSVEVNGHLRRVNAYPWNILEVAFDR